MNDNHLAAICIKYNVYIFYLMEYFIKEVMEWYEKVLISL